MFFVENNGTVTLSGLDIRDELVGDIAACGVSGDYYLAPGQRFTCMSTYQVCRTTETQAIPTTNLTCDFPYLSRQQKTCDGRGAINEYFVAVPRSRGRTSA